MSEQLWAEAMGRLDPVGPSERTDPKKVNCQRRLRPFSQAEFRSLPTEVMERLALGSMAVKKP